MMRRMIRTTALFAAVLFVGTVTISAPGNKTSPSGRLPAAQSTHTNPDLILFEDSMTGNWQDNWFLDGTNALLNNSENGLYFAAGTYMYPDMDNRTYEQRVEMSAHHAVLWTRQEFEGDLLIRYECTRVDRSPFGVNIIYIQAQGIGTGEFPKDIYEWRAFRESPGMGKYYTYMNALHVSYNVGDFETPSYIRARRYPKNDPIGLRWGMTKIEPDYNDAGAKMMPGKTYILEWEKRKRSLTFRIFDKETNELLKECVWDISSDNLPELMEPKIITKGRIGFRQMSTKQNIYKNFKVIRLSDKQSRAKEDQKESVGEGPDCPFVFFGKDGKLVYKPYTEKGDRIIDFSYAGYKASEEPIPDVRMVETIDPLPGKVVPEGTMAYPKGPDSLARIQAALDRAAALDPGPNGYRGAVVLTQGTYYLNGGLKLSSGVVLRGAGDGPNGTVLIFRNPQGTGISLGQNVNAVELGAPTLITDDYVPAGSTELTVKNAGSFAAGDPVRITKTVNDAWINTLGMSFPNGPRPGRRLTPWTPEAYQIKHLRRITSIDGNRLRLDVPLPQSLAKEYGGGRVTKVDVSDTESHMGVEDLRIISNYDTSITSTVRADKPYQADEEHNLNAGIELRCVQSWVRSCTILHTSRKAVGMSNSRYITVRDCTSLEPISIIKGARRYSFSNSDSSMTLVYNCTAEEGRHDFVTGSQDSGPIAFVRGRAEGAHAASETHQRWATGVLFDSLEIKNGGGIMAINRNEAGSGHGWSGANVVVWNCVSPFVEVHNPPTPEQNFAIGCTATAPSDARWTGVTGSGFLHSIGAPVEPASLFEAQLIDRIGREKAERVLAEKGPGNV